MRTPKQIKDWWPTATNPLEMITTALLYPNIYEVNNLLIVADIADLCCRNSKDAVVIEVLALVRSMRGNRTASSAEACKKAAKRAFEVATQDMYKDSVYANPAGAIAAAALAYSDYSNAGQLGMYTVVETAVTMINRHTDNQESRLKGYSKICGIIRQYLEVPNMPPAKLPFTD